MKLNFCESDNMSYVYQYNEGQGRHLHESMGSTLSALMKFCWKNQSGSLLPTGRDQKPSESPLQGVREGGGGGVEVRSLMKHICSRCRPDCTSSCAPGSFTRAIEEGGGQGVRETKANIEGSCRCGN